MQSTRTRDRYRFLAVTTALMMATGLVTLATGSNAQAEDGVRAGLDAPVTGFERAEHRAGGAAKDERQRLKQQQKAERRVLRMSGRLASRPPGMPGAGARRLASAYATAYTYSQHRFTASFELDAVPNDANNAWVDIEFGFANGNTCEGDRSYVSTTLNPDSGFTRNGKKMTFSRNDIFAIDQHDCAFVILGNSDFSTQYSALVGDLKPTYAKSNLEFKKLGTKRLVNRSTTKVEVKVKNTGQGDAGSVVITGKAARGIKVTKVKLPNPYLPSKSKQHIEVPIKLGRKVPKKSKVTLTIKTFDSKDTMTFKVRNVPPPPRPKPGEYVGVKNKTVGFIVNKKGQVRNWRGYLFGMCGTDFTASGYYGFRKASIPRNGIVDAVERGELYTIHLDMRFNGSKVTQGRIYYNGPGLCWASLSFKAKRKGPL